MEIPDHFYEIPLTFRRTDFEALFFAGGKDRLFYYKPVKQTFFFLVLGLLVTLAGIPIFLQTQAWVGIPILGILLSVGMAWLFVKQAYLIIKWKSDVKTYINHLAQTKTYRLRISPSSICLVQDGTELFTKWSSFVKVEIHPEYILLREAGTNHYFPRASMNETDFGWLTQEIRKHFRETVS